MLEHVEYVLHEALVKPSFAAQLGTDASILNGFLLTVEERLILIDHDAQALLDLGVDEKLLGGWP